MKLYSIDTGYFKLDGGAMFGVVPKMLWQQLNPPDENNMCTWALRCLLVEDQNRLLLIDTGIGNFMNATYLKRYQPFGEATIESSLAKHGFSVNDVTDILLTHLHFDHCCGCLTRTSDGVPALRFPNATIWSSYQQWQWAEHSNPREKASFLNELLEPIKKSGKLKFVENDDIGIKNMDIEFMYGHTESMMICHLYKDSYTITYCADLIPSVHHIRLPYIMSYDVRPLDSLKEKQILLEKAYENNHILFFEHDKDIEACTIKKTDKGIEFDNIILIKDL